MCEKGEEINRSNNKSIGEVISYLPPHWNRHEFLDMFSSSDPFTVLVMKIPHILSLVCLMFNCSL